MTKMTANNKRNSSILVVHVDIIHAGSVLPACLGTLLVIGYTLGQPNK